MNTIELRRGSERCQCGVCGEYFSTTSNFDKHRTGSYEGTRRCMTVREMEKKGLVQVNGIWQGKPSQTYSLASRADEAA